MGGKARHYFPGNNTPGGFFSYYNQVIDPKEAQRIWCLKGGPGTGKSTLIKKIGEAMLAEGKDVDFLHCSSDSSSLDGVLIGGQKVFIVDGTAPHVIDPIYPGVVDSIVNLSDFWNEEGLRSHRKEIIQLKEEIGGIFRLTYNYLKAVEVIYDNLLNIPGRPFSQHVYNHISGKIISSEFNNKRKSAADGKVRNFFASAITPQGNVNYIQDLIKHYNKIYIINAPVGIGSEMILSQLLSESVYRGYLTEACYCSLKPSFKIEHLLIPQLSLAIVSSNEFHPFSCNSREKEVINIDLLLDRDKTDPWMEGVSLDCIEKMKDLLEKAIYCLGRAKEKHSLLEGIYLPYMDLKGLDQLSLKIEKMVRGYLPS